MKRFVVILGLLLCSVLLSYSRAQGQVLVTGVVVEESGPPLVGATVVVSGTRLGTVTDLDGTFRLLVPQSALSGGLVITYIGFETTYMMFYGPDGLRTYFYVIMRDDSDILDEEI